MLVARLDMYRLALLVLAVGRCSCSESMCSASLAPSIAVCNDGACNSAAIEVDDTVTFQVCVENLSFEMPGSTETTPVAAVLQANTQIQVFLACQTGTCDGAMWSGTLDYQGYTQLVPSTFVLGATDTCSDATLCGLLSLTAELALPEYSLTTDSQICLGTITTTAVDKPDSSLGLFYQKADTGDSDLLVTDPTCVGGLTGGGEGTSVARFLPPPSPSPPPSPPPLSPPPSPPPPAPRPRRGRRSGWSPSPWRRRRRR